MDIENEKEPDVRKNKTEMSTFALHINAIFCFYPRCDQRAKKYFNLYWQIVQISYHRFNNLTKLLNGDLAAKIRQGIFS